MPSIKGIKRIKKLIPTIFIGAAFMLIVAACSHNSNNTSGTNVLNTVEQATTASPPISLPPIVVVNPDDITTTTKEVRTPAETTEPTEVTTRKITGDTPTVPQAELATRYILAAKSRPPNPQGQISRKVINVYNRLNGELITEEVATDPETGEPILDPETEEPEMRCLQDFPDTCLPSDPTNWGVRLTFLVTQGEPGDEWAEVLLATRPNDSKGWVKTEDFEWSTHNFHIVIDLTERTLSVWQGLQGTEPSNRKLVIHTAAIIGKSSSPTPTIATTYVEAEIENDSKSKAEGGYGIQYGTWILPLATFSDSLTEFQGGSPRVAIHGTNIPDSIGQALSSGCIRIPNDMLDKLVAMIPLGTPVSIIA